MTTNVETLTKIFELFLNDAPFKVDGAFWNPKDFARYCVEKLETAEGGHNEAGRHYMGMNKHE